MYLNFTMRTMLGIRGLKVLDLAGLPPNLPSFFRQSITTAYKTIYFKSLTSTPTMPRSQPLSSFWRLIQPQLPSLQRIARDIMVRGGLPNLDDLELLVDFFMRHYALLRRAPHYPTNLIPYLNQLRKCFTPLNFTKDNLRIIHILGQKIAKSLAAVGLMLR